MLCKTGNAFRIRLKHWDYVNTLHLIWDGSIAFGLPMFYIVFSILFFARSYRMKGSKEVIKQQKLMLLQVFLISMLNSVTTSTYVSQMYFVPNEFIIHFAQFCWLHIHGFHQ
uniref:Very-long-chain 3-oxoacyl-CoA synthase n=1 Tax=Ditylenchus dipsaci TaxID=166011 RepID=A0A915E1C2_9BILA